MPRAAISRNYYRLSEGRTVVGGLDLIKSLVDYKDRRRMLITLTLKGISIAKELTEFIQ